MSDFENEIVEQQVASDFEEEAPVVKRGKKAKKPVVVVDDESDAEEEPVVKPKKGKKKAVVVTEDAPEEVVAPEPEAPKKKAGKKKVVATDLVVEEVSEETEEASEEKSDSSSTKRKVKTPVERIDFVLKKLEEGVINKEVVSQLQMLRKQLDGAKIKKSSSVADSEKRAPSAYNLYMREKMAELKDNGMTPKERFAECIRLWKLEKA